MCETHLAGSTVTILAAARRRGGARGSGVACDLRPVVSVKFSCRKSDGQVIPWALLNITRWISGIRSKRVSIVNGKEGKKNWSNQRGW